MSMAFDLLGNGSLGSSFFFSHTGSGELGSGFFPSFFYHLSAVLTRDSTWLHCFFSILIYPYYFSRFLNTRVHQFEEFQFITIIMPLIEMAKLWLTCLLGNSHVTGLLVSSSHDHLGNIVPPVIAFHIRTQRYSFKP
jgi:hypothetical protein